MITKGVVKDAAVQLGRLEYALIGSCLDDKYVEAVPNAIRILRAVADDDVLEVVNLKRQLEATEAQVRTQQAMIDSYQAELKVLKEELEAHTRELDGLHESDPLTDYRYFIP